MNSSQFTKLRPSDSSIYNLKALHLSNTFIRWCITTLLFFFFFHAGVLPKMCRGSFGCSRGEANGFTLTCWTCIYRKSTTMSELWNGGWSLEFHHQYTHYMYRLVLSWPWFRHSFFTVYMDSFLKWLTIEIYAWRRLNDCVVQRYFSSLWCTWRYIFEAQNKIFIFQQNSCD